MKKDKLELEGLVDVHDVEDAPALHIEDKLLSELFIRHFEGLSDCRKRSWHCKITIEVIETYDDSRAASQ